MPSNKTNLLWKSFKGVRELNTINSDSEFGADEIQNVMLSKEKSGQFRSIRSAGWFDSYNDAPSGELVIKLFSANISGYENPNQLIAFAKSTAKINVYLVSDDQTSYLWTKIAEFPLATDVTDVCMTQFGDRLVLACVFGTGNIGFVAYSATTLTGWTQTGATSWYYRVQSVQEQTTLANVTNITSIKPYRSRLAINGETTYTENSVETIYGIWFSEAGNPINFAHDYATEATDTSAFFVEVGEPINTIVEYHGLTCFGLNRSYNISGITSSDITVLPLTAKGVTGNAVFVLNGQCAYIDNYSENVFTLRDNIDSTIGFDQSIGDDIQSYTKDVKDVSINALGRRVRLMKKSGQALVYDVDVGEWTIEQFNENSRSVTFLNKEIFCDGTNKLYEIKTVRSANSTQIPTEQGYYSYYKTNLIWLDSQSSVKSHLYPIAFILEPQTTNQFYVKFTTDRGLSQVGEISKSAYQDVATYSTNDTIPADGSKFVSSDDDYSGGVFFRKANTDLLVTVPAPGFWRYLQIEIYTTSPTQEFNISGIEAKMVHITDEGLDY